MISGGIEANYIVEIRLLLEARFTDDPLGLVTNLADIPIVRVHDT